MIKDKNWFINQYSEIHENLFDLEKRIDEYQRNKFLISNEPEILDNLKNMVHKEILRLNKTRENERKIFNY
jgi:hypothetical protein